MKPLLEVKARIEFEPTHYSKKHEEQATWKSVAMVRTECDLHSYYAWFLRKRFDLFLIPPLRGSHVTFINEIVDPKEFEKAKKQFHGKYLTFYYDPVPKSNGAYWWLRVWSPDIDAIRISMGLSKDPYYGLHITIGYPKKTEVKFSHYILEKCKEFNLIEYEPKMPLSEYKIVKYD